MHTEWDRVIVPEEKMGERGKCETRHPSGREKSNL